VLGAPLTVDADAFKTAAGDLIARHIAVDERDADAGVD
jgi:hypothetical protein